MPKGVVWRHEDVFYALGGGTDPVTNERTTEPESMVAKGANGGLVHLPVAPLMHGATQWCVMGQSFVGAKIVLMAKFDPHEVWRLVGDEKVNSVMITGDAMGKPLIESLDDEGTDHDLSSLLAVVSSAALFSAPVKDQFFEHLPNLVITDAIGSSEGGNNGMTVVTAGNTAMKSGPTVHLLGETVVFDEDLQPVEPGSGVIGKIARSGDIPLGYYNDPKKTAEVFIQVRGTRYVMPGDYATVEADGSITLLGRGSIVINSGGEKIFPEEVESAVRSHPDVMDAIVCGAPDERWGQTVAAIVQPRVGHDAPSLASLQEHCRESIAGYKLPRRLYVVDAVERSPSGKPDYTWAAAIVNADPDGHEPRRVRGLSGASPRQLAVVRIGHGSTRVRHRLPLTCQHLADQSRASANARGRQRTARDAPRGVRSRGGQGRHRRAHCAAPVRGRAGATASAAERGRGRRCGRAHRTSTPRRRGPSTTATRSGPATTRRASPSPRQPPPGPRRCSTARCTGSRSRRPGGCTWRPRTTPSTRWPPTPAPSCGPAMSGHRCPPSDLPCGDISPTVGITGTPVSTPPAARSSRWPTS